MGPKRSDGGVHGVLLSRDSDSPPAYTVDLCELQSAAVTRHNGGTPTFATATWLNQPIYVEVPSLQYCLAGDTGICCSWSIPLMCVAFTQTFNCTDNGTNIWSYSTTNDQVIYAFVFLIR